MRALIVALMAIALATTVAAKDWSKQARHALQRVVEIRMTNPVKPETVMVCSAWVWDQKHGLGITAGHCAIHQHYMMPNMMTLHTEGGDGAPIHLIAADLGMDMALIQSEGFKDIKALKRGPMPEVGDEVMAAGWTSYGDFVVKPGNVATLPRDVGVIVQNQIGIDGMSGGVLLDTKGRVVGILSSTYPEIGALTAISVESLEAFVEEYAEDPQ